MSYRILILIGVLAALVGLFFILPSPASDSGWAIRADAPEVIGGYGDNFCYDGKGVQTLSGTLSLVILKDGTGSIAASVSTTDGSGPLHPASSDELTGTFRILSRIDAASKVRQNIELNGDIAGGDPNLPQTHALLAGKSAFDIYVDGKLL